MQAISDIHCDFSLRLKRIEASSVARTQRVFVGEDESCILSRRMWNVEKSGPGALIRWVSQMLAHTQAPTVLRRGISFVL